MASLVVPWIHRDVGNRAIGIEAQHAAWNTKGDPKAHPPPSDLGPLNSRIVDECRGWAAPHCP